MTSPESDRWYHYALIIKGNFVSGYVNGTYVDPVRSSDEDTELALSSDQLVMFVGKQDSEGNSRGNFHLDDLYIMPYALNQNDLDLFQK